MILVDRLLAAGVRFVLDTLAKTAAAELDDAANVREALLDAQMRLELGALTEEEFAALEAELTGRLRAIRERERTAVEGASVAGVEVSVHDDEHA